MAEVDPTRRRLYGGLRAAFGFVEVLRVVDHNDGQDQDDEPSEEGDPPASADR